MQWRPHSLLTPMEEPILMQVVISGPTAARNAMLVALTLAKMVEKMNVVAMESALAKKTAMAIVILTMNTESELSLIVRKKLAKTTLSHI